MFILSSLKVARPRLMANYYRLFIAFETPQIYR
jgi:hypothetical protein